MEGGDNYYICGQDGIYEINLATCKMRNDVEQDLSQCVLAKLIYIKENNVFQLITDTVAETAKFGRVIAINIVQENIAID